MKKTRNGPPSSTGRGGNGGSKKGGGPSSSTNQQQQQQNRIALLDSLDDMQDAKVRLEACAAIASKFEPLEEKDRDVELRMRKEIAKLGREGMFKSLVRNVNDSDGLVSINAIGALRNLAITGGDKALALMQQEDAWTALSTIVAAEPGRGSSTLASASVEARAELETSLKKEALSVMGSMCEWSPSIAERRLPDSLGLIASCFHNAHKDVVESAAKLIYMASEENASLANAMVSTDIGKQLALTLQTLLGRLSELPNDNLVAAAYALGILLNVSMCFEHAEMPQMVANWFSLARNILAETSLPLVTISDEIVQDAVAFESDDMLQEDGNNKSETERMRKWLDAVEAQTLVFEVFSSMLNKVTLRKEDNERKQEKLQYLSRITEPLEVTGLLTASLTFSCFAWPGEINGPTALSLPVVKLQESAAECASACFDTFSTINSSFLIAAWTRMLKVLSETSSQGLNRPEVDDRLIAFARMIAAIARRTNQPLPQLDELVKVMRECRVEEVRALLCGALLKICQLDLTTLLQPVARSLIEAMTQEKSLIVASEEADALMDLFSEEDRQGLFDSLNGGTIFAGFSKEFDKRLSELKRREDKRLEEEDLERLDEIKTNVDGFLKWKKSIVA